jgi:general secretion pathway protein D
MVAEPSINAVILADTAENVEKISRLLALIDADIFKDIHWKLFTLRYTEVDDISKDLEKIVQNKGLYGKKGLEEGAFQVLPLKSINAVMVVTKWPELIDVIGGWLNELDSLRSGKGTQVHVYFVQNGKAKDMADLLSQVFGLKKASTKSAKDKKTVLVTETKEEKKEKEKPVIVPETLAGEEGGEVAKDVLIIPDEANNALLIKARPGDYETIANILKKIDVLPRQVLIDVLILEVTLTDGIEYGVEWFLKNKGIRIGPRSYDGFMTLDDGVTSSPDTALGKGIPGFAYSLFDSEGGLRTLVTAIADTTKVNVLSSPNILAVDNQESKIEVGEEVPTLSGSTVTDVGTTQLVQYKNTGVILKVKPYINSSGLVRIEITQEISSVISETTGNINSPRFRSRKATTYIVANDDQTIVMGGLMQTQKDRVTAGVPLLKDIPVLGYAFGKKTFKTEKTELIFIITPHVIQSREQADLLTKEFTERVESLKEILENQKVDLNNATKNKKDER